MAARFSPSRNQFSLTGLLLFTTAVCALMAVLAALGIGPVQLLVGILVIGGVTAILIAIISFSTRFKGE